MDQIVSSQPGLIAQVSGALTRARVWGFTVFVDHLSDVTFGFPMCNFTTEETIKAKAAYEFFMQGHGHIVKAYRADNGRFTDNDFVQSINESNQTLTLCGVGAHHQNGISESRIKQLSLACRTMLLHAKRH